MASGGQALRYRLPMAPASDHSDPTPPEFSKDRAKSFLQDMVGILNSGAMAIMVSVGHKTGLFDAMDGAPPETVEDVAKRAGLHPRPVREWLAAASCAGVVEHDPARGTYRLPAEHAGLLTRRSGPLNLAVQAQYVGLFGAVEDDVTESFKDGSGVPYDKYPKFQAVMAQSSGDRQERTLLQAVVPILPGGADALEQGADVADVGCGSGLALCLLGEAFPQSRFTGFDFSEEAIGVARERATERGLANVSFEVADAAALEVEHQFDLVTTFDAVHDQSQPAKVLKGIHRMLRPGGTYLCVEPKALERPGRHARRAHGPLPLHHLHDALHAGLSWPTVARAWAPRGGEQTAVQYLENAGFKNIEVTGVREDRANSFFIARA